MAYPQCQIAIREPDMREPRTRMLRKIAVAITLLAVFATALAAQPRAPKIAVGDADPVTIEWQHGTPFPGGWWRVDAVPAPGLVAQGFASSTHLLVDVFNVGEDPVRIAFVGAEGDAGEYDRVVPPGAGLAWSSSPPTAQIDDPGPGEWDDEYVAKPWAKVDTGWTLQTGSPRNRFFSPHRWRVSRDVLSRTMEAWLDRWVRWQLQRTYQDPDPARALPRALLELPAGGGGTVSYEEIGAVTPMDTHHQTVGVLADAWLLTRNPRALDQLVRELVWSYETQDYYDPEWAWPYGGIERVPGWLLVGLADGAEVCRDAGLPPLVARFAAQARDHVALLEELGFNELGLPNIVAPKDPRHIDVPHNLPWQGAIVAFGLLRVDAELGTPGARNLAERWLDYLQTRGWDGDQVVFDAVPHALEDQDVAPSRAGIPGVGFWLAPPLILAGRTDSLLLAMLVGRAKSIRYQGAPIFSRDGFVSLFGPLIP